MGTGSDGRQGREENGPQKGGHDVRHEEEGEQNRRIPWTRRKVLLTENLLRVSGEKGQRKKGGKLWKK